MPEPLISHSTALDLFISLLYIEAELRKHTCINCIMYNLWIRFPNHIFFQSSTTRKSVASHILHRPVFILFLVCFFFNWCCCLGSGYTCKMKDGHVQNANSPFCDGPHKAHAVGVQKVLLHPRLFLRSAEAAETLP